MTILYSSPQAAPPVLGSPWPVGDDQRLRRNVRRAATVPLALCLAVQWVFLVSWGLPEAAGLPGLDWWRGQLAPLGLTPGHRLGAGVLLSCAVALFALSRTRHWFGRATMVVPATVGSLTAALVLLGLLLEPTPVPGVGLLLLLGWVVPACYAAVHALLVELGPPPAPTRRSGVLLVAAWVLLLPGPVALGRLMLAGDLRAEAIVLRGNRAALQLGALLTGTSVRLALFGALLGVLVWLTYQCWPRRGTSRSWRWYTATAVTLLLVLQLWWSGQTSAARRVTQLQFGTPVADLHFTCGSWVYPPAPGTAAATPTVTFVASGLNCTTMTTYVGYRQLGTTATGISVSPVSMRALPRRTSDSVEAPKSEPLVGARYGNVIVLAASDRLDRVADQLVAVPVRGGAPLWHFTCDDKGEVRARFPGGRTDPASTATVPGEPGAAVVLSCGDRKLRLDPTTGLTAGS